MPDLNPGLLSQKSGALPMSHRVYKVLILKLQKGKYAAHLVAVWAADVLQDDLPEPVGEGVERVVGVAHCREHTVQVGRQAPRELQLWQEEINRFFTLVLTCFHMFYINQGRKTTAKC